MGGAGGYPRESLRPYDANAMAETGGGHAGRERPTFARSRATDIPPDGGSTCGGRGFRLATAQMPRAQRTRQRSSANQYGAFISRFRTAAQFVTGAINGC